jgi:transcriptional regulator with XRE-family HTH domain
MTEIDLKRQKIFGEHFKKLREAKGLSQDDVAARSRLTKSSVSVIENGNRNFSFSTLLALAKAIDVEPMLLLDVNFELWAD